MYFDETVSVDWATCMVNGGRHATHEDAAGRCS